MTNKPDNRPTRGKGEKKAPRAAAPQGGRREPASAPTATAASERAPAQPAPARAERIAKVLARAGVASRRDAERMIEAGRVTLNGERLSTPAVTVGPGDAILVDGRPLAEPEPPRLWRYHKPNGLVTSSRDEKGRDTIFDHLPPGLPRVVTVGRLDLTSEGLLLLTNDGELKRRLELPKTAWLRRYRVRLHGRPTEASLRPLEQGMTVDGERFQPMMAALERQQGANAWVTLGLKEGKNREIRRALEALGFTVNRLIRIGYGPFRLGELPPGAVEEVRAAVMREQLGLEVETPAARERRARAARDNPAGPGAPDPGADGADDTAARPSRTTRPRTRNRP
ncbi:MAG: rRNA pseudouridine synthase [Rhodobacteraceae bacterium]|nr:rRNA pseudouridine synthase [Paracoccaceae bacterium]